MPATMRRHANVIPMKWMPAPEVTQAMRASNQPAHINSQAQEYFGMYNDRPQIDDGADFGAGLSKNDTRAKAGGMAAWSDPLTHSRYRWDEKYVPESAAGFDPTSQSEMKGGLTADERDALLREKEGGAKAFAGQMVNERGVLKGDPRSPFKNVDPIYSERPTIFDRVTADAKAPLKPTAEPSWTPSQLAKMKREANPPQQQHGYGNSKPLHNAYWDAAEKKRLQQQQAEARSRAMLAQRDARTAPPS